MMFMSYGTINYKVYDKDATGIDRVNMDALDEEEVPITEQVKPPPPPPPPPPAPEVIEIVDADGDGFDNDIDCDDQNADVYPDASEVCDEIDNNCNNLVDAVDMTITGEAFWYRDVDQDGVSRVS